MEDPIKKVLDMLEEGKISVEEAERLIRAIKEAISKGQKYSEYNKKNHDLGRTLRDVFTTVSETISESIDSAIHLAKNFKTYENFHTEGKERIRISLLGGDLKLSTYERSEISGYFTGSYSTGETSVSFTITEAANLLIPEKTTLEISSLGGDANISGKYKILNISLKGGELKIDVTFDDLFAKILGGDLQLIIPRFPVKVKIKRLGGDAYLPKELYRSDDYYIFGDTDHKYIEVKLIGGDFTLSFKEA
ncbi:MAG: hypothetical protein ABIL91_04430 [candidate division WOR-3 bacterium]